MLAALVLKRPCPWCGCAIAVQPGMPDANLARRMESRCSSCRGGVCAHASWRVFLTFIAVYGAVSNLLLWCLAQTWTAWRTDAPVGGEWSAHAGWTALAIAGFIVVTLLAQRFLIGASRLLRGKPPRDAGADPA